MNQENKSKDREPGNHTGKEPAISKVATNPNLRANENLKDKQQQVSQENKSSLSGINGEITDGEDA